MALFISLSSTVALAIIGLLGADWWLFSARAMATLIRAYRSMHGSVALSAASRHPPRVQLLQPPT